ncbi:MAG: FkbM family methyltransferase [Elainellaceae cyanobacterium]
MENFFGKIRKLYRILKSPASFYYYPKPTLDHHRLCFSQEGEDMILSRLFSSQKEGFYIDIGAHHPQKFSNTYGFYLKGWRGINIDAMPGSMEPFERVRAEDINLEAAIARDSGMLTFYSYNNPVLNTFSKSVHEQRLGNKEFSHLYPVREALQIETHPLVAILEQHLPEDQVIDFMSIDVEGLDYEILSSNDWSRYRPKVVIAEDIDSVSLSSAQNCSVSTLMFGQGYELIAKTVNSLFFLDHSLEISDNFCDLRVKRA